MKLERFFIRSKARAKLFQRQPLGLNIPFGKGGREGYVVIRLLKESRKVK